MVLKGSGDPPESGCMDLKINRTFNSLPATIIKNIDGGPRILVALDQDERKMSLNPENLLPLLSLTELNNLQIRIKDRKDERTRISEEAVSVQLQMSCPKHPNTAMLY